jgi:nicotinate-nucleotide adenylyltransferase
MSTPPSTESAVTGGPAGPMGIFGGTFDPIHYGHLRTAFELLETLRLPEMRFMPAGSPPHRVGTFATNEERVAMVRAATAGQPGFTVDDREMHRTGPSYTIETLIELRLEYPERPICLVVGMDAFLGLPKWHRWRELLSVAHLVVAHRPGWRAPTMGPLGELLVDHGTGTVRDLHTALSGRIYIHAVTQLEISSTDVRALISTGRDPRFLMPEGVRRIIMESGCYARKDGARA